MRRWKWWSPDVRGVLYELLDYSGQLDLAVDRPREKLRSWTRRVILPVRSESGTSTQCPFRLAPAGWSSRVQ
jgi:hypothetical protein